MVKKYFIPLFFLLFIFFACTRADPTIDFYLMKLVYEETENGIVPGFTFFALVNDDDGPEDIAEIRLYHDAEGLMWTLKPDNWTILEEHNKIWIGSKSLRMSDGELLPKGEFRATIEDKSGQSGEKIFGFDTAEDSQYRFPTLKIENKNYSIRSSYPENYFLLYFQDGSYRSLLKAENLNGSLASLKLPSDAYSIALWADDTSKAISALTKKVYIRE
jgi:hypothetical protein